MPKLPLDNIPPSNSTGYPPPFDAAVAGRWNRRLSPIMGLVDFGASDCTLQPGAWSSQRHWHEDEDELVVMLSGEAVLVEEGGRTRLHAGDIAVFPKGAANGHHLINDSDAPCRFLAIGRKPEGRCHYPDIDLVWDGPSGTYRHRDGRPY